jgi:hypothetical protein
MVFNPKSRTNKWKKDDSTPTAQPSSSQTQPPPTAKPATPPPRPATPPAAPPPAPIISTPTPTRRQVNESPLSSTPNGSMSKRARKRQEALDRAAIAECSRREISIKVLKGTGPSAEAVEASENVCHSPKTPQSAANRRSPSPTKPKPGPGTPRSAKKPKRRHEKLDLYDPAIAAAERIFFLKNICQEDEPSTPAKGAHETAKDSPMSPAFDSPMSPGPVADQHSCSPSTSQRADKHMSKKSRRH